MVDHSPEEPTRPTTSVIFVTFEGILDNLLKLHYKIHDVIQRGYIEGCFSDEEE